MATTATIDAKIDTTIAGGGYTIDLTSVAGQDGTGLRIQRISVYNPPTSAGNVTVAEGASNGRPIPSPIVVPPGSNFVQTYNDFGVDIGATDKTLDVSGTDGDTPIVAISLA